MPIPLFPGLTPKVTDSLWFSIDKPCDDENEIAVLEEENQAWLSSLAQEDCDNLPIGKSALEHMEEEDDDDDDEEEDDNDDDTDSHDDEDDEELDMEVSNDRDSPVEMR